jgi:diguanylate cyclase (GGDEF)-like protein
LKLDRAGQNLGDMQSALDIGVLQLELLKSLDPVAVAQTINCITESFAKPQALAVLLWDPDFDAFSEHHKYVFGPQAAELNAVLATVTEKSPQWNQLAIKQHIPELSAAATLMQCFLRDGEPVGALLLASDAEFSAQALSEYLGQFPIAIAMGNAFEYAELKREVERLREHYELLESDLIEQKRLAALNGGPETPNPAKFRLEQSDKEKLVYEISNAVRSSLDIREVLQTAVSKIGGTFKLSRCFVIWPMPESDEYTLYEYYDESVQSAKQLFFTENGRNFVRAANEKTAPHDFSAESKGNDHEVFDKKFLEPFGLLSGMLVPLIYQDRNIGSLFLQDCMTPREWSIDNTALIGSLGDLVTVAIEHANMHEEKKRQAVTDGLTGIANRRHFNETLIKEFERAKRYGDELSLVVVDMDFLKKINDTFGHQTGDQAIKAIGSVLSRSCRSVDLAARFGGEEFCLLLPGTGIEDALRLAERVRRLIEQTPVDGPGQITASLGVSTYPAHCSEPDGLFESADQALYLAKSAGRNRVVSAQALQSKE